MSDSPAEKSELNATHDLQSVTREDAKMLRELFGTITGTPLCIGGQGMLQKPHALRDAGVTHILTVAADVTVPECISQEFEWLRIPVYDSPDEDKFLKLLPRCMEFIDAASRTHTKCYVHCMYGVSRSAAVVVAWLMRRSGEFYGKQQFEKALQRVQRDWPDANPSYFFIKQLSAGPAPPQRTSHANELHSYRNTGEGDPCFYNEYASYAGDTAIGRHGVEFGCEVQ